MTPILPAARPWVMRWGDDPWSFNLDFGHDEEDDGDLDAIHDGMPGRAVVAGAILRWAASVPGVDAAAAAMVFNLPIGFASDAFREDLYRPSSLAEAVQVWSLLVAEPTSVALASAVFGVRPEEILTVIEEHYYMFPERRDGVVFIGHEGE